MYGKLAGGDRLTLYKDQVAARAIKKAYDDAVEAKKSKTAIIADMTKVIVGQIDRGSYISKHLKKGAVDIRSRDMSVRDKENFKTAAKATAKSIILETTPPHFHLQF